MKKIILLIMPAALLFQLAYAGFHMGMAGAVKDKVEKLDKKVKKAKNTIVIEGKKTISGQAFELEPGMTVKFKEKFLYTGPGGPIYEGGELELTNGAKLIAKGTWSEPIIFEESGKITFKENSDGENSVIEYSKFEDMSITMKNSVTIQYNKFNYSWIEIGENSKALIQYNNFMAPSSFGLGAIRGSNGGASIQYNNIEGHYNGVAASGAIIKFNNITNTDEYAISAGVADNNYIANCNGKQGVDTTGEQVSPSITYENPHTSPIPNAGAGW